MTALQSTPRRSAVTSMKASRVNGDGSLSAQEIAVQVDAFEAAVHVVGVVHDHAAGAEQLGLDRVHVVAAIDRVARDQRDRGRAARHDAEQALVVVGGRAQADQLPLGPGAAAVHGRVDAAGVVGLAGEAERVGLAVGRPVVRAVERPDRDAGDVLGRAVGADGFARTRAPSAPWRRRRVPAASGDSTGLFMTCFPRRRARLPAAPRARSRGSGR